MSMNVGGSKGSAIADINVTPMADIKIVLLIIFMVITPMMVKQFWLHVPKKEAAAPVDDAPDDPNNVPIVVTVRSNGSIWINKDPVEIDQLPDRLARIFAARDQVLVFFDAEDGVPYGNAMRVLDAARGGGAINIAVLTDPMVP